MIILITLLIFMAVFLLVYFILSKGKTADIKPPTLPLEKEISFEKKGFMRNLFSHISLINKPLAGAFRYGLSRKLYSAKIKISIEEFFLIKELLIITLLVLFLPMIKQLSPIFYLVPIIVGFFLPDIWLIMKIKAIKQELVKNLPDAIDLLNLCVNAGLDFMLALKWVIDKSPANALIDELNLVMQEINLGRPRKDTLIDLAKRYDIAELSTFSRTLVQADRMGTSVAEALNILSEDMRLSRFRLGEQMALKAPIKLLFPLLVFIFPVVGIIIGAPIILQFLQTKTFSAF
ncbi:MAG: type II secretion system F family protein [Candidatus Omnitrophota bacterium]|nr:type II secretion system F family protein [Candidatus Omnitrophota bacterium]